MARIAPMSLLRTDTASLRPRLSHAQVPLPVEPGVVLLDIAFTDTDPKHGFLTGTRQTLLETEDGGKTWEPRFFESVEEEGINYRYNSISFSGDEGYIVGKPGATAAPLLLLSRFGGR
jgi:photosystem II stability/assembly factor-like uncharacterized protein